ncbi:MULTISPECIES: HAD-IA family hydrolase [Streptomyces]|uniref:HAD-IA family hydrolase n=1 Tax=Streptomyces TaxID=1883 RepID=UPI000B323B4F|nr:MULTISPECIES: HAD-IA family hydrolase [Streptomyces]
MSGQHRWTARAVLFDLDGVLVDSMPLIGALLDRWADLHRLDRELVHRTAHGRREAELAAALVPSADPEEQVALMQGWQLTEFDGCRPCPGAAGLIARLDEGQWAVVTSGSGPVARGRLRAAGLPAPRTMVTADDVVRGKPDPEPYLRAAAALGVDVAECVVIEDAPSGAAAGLAAGMRLITVTGTDATWPDALSGPVVRVDSLERIAVAGAGPDRVDLLIGAEGEVVAGGGA